MIGLEAGSAWYRSSVSLSDLPRSWLVAAKMAADGTCSTIVELRFSVGPGRGLRREGASPP